MDTVEINVELNNKRNRYIKNIIEKWLGKNYFIIKGVIKREFKRAV
jgi:hypothetical protein